MSSSQIELATQRLLISKAVLGSSELAQAVTFLTDTRSPGRVQALRAELQQLREHSAAADPEVPQEELDWELVLGAVDSNTRFTTLLSYTPIRWLSFFQCVQRFLACWTGVTNLLTKVSNSVVSGKPAAESKRKAKFLLAELAELRGVMIWLAEFGAAFTLHAGGSNYQ